jgi:hypothetical protein
LSTFGKDVTTAKASYQKAKELKEKLEKQQQKKKI